MQWFAYLSTCVSKSLMWVSYFDWTELNRDWTLASISCALRSCSRASCSNWAIRCSSIRRAAVDGSAFFEPTARKWKKTLNFTADHLPYKLDTNPINWTWRPDFFSPWFAPSPCTDAASPVFASHSRRRHHTPCASRPGYRPVRVATLSALRWRPHDLFAPPAIRYAIYWHIHANAAHRSSTDPFLRASDCWCRAISDAFATHYRTAAEDFAIVPRCLWESRANSRFAARVHALVSMKMSSMRSSISALMAWKMHYSDWFGPECFSKWHRSHHLWYHLHLCACHSPSQHFRFRSNRSVSPHQSCRVD